jgi:hypothetical protein
VNFLTIFIDAVEATVGDRIAACHVVTVVGKLFSGVQSRGIPHNFITFNHQLAAIRVN